MLDFVKIYEDQSRKNTIELYPTFRIIGHPKDLMIRGRDFYAVWDEEAGLWSKEEDTVVRLIDRELYSRKAEIEKEKDGLAIVKVRSMEDSKSGVIDSWHKYVQKQMRDCYRELDESLTFANTETEKKDFASKRLSYSLIEGPYSAWDELVSILYESEEREKIEWAIGSIVAGESKKIQKFVVFYGEGGTGKSTIMNIIEKLFDGYYNRFDAKELTSSNNSFALESFKTNPLVSIQHDGDLSRIEDNTKLNSIVSHESMEVNEKFKAKYVAKFNSFLFMGTNKPVKITEARSGIIRRLIDVRPSGRKIPRAKYDELLEKIDFQLGGIAYHCLEVYKKLGKGYYDNYIPKDMIKSTNDFYDFMETYYDLFLKADGTSLKAAWELYFREYCEYANVINKLTMRAFRVELSNYFDVVKDSCMIDGVRYRSYFSGFKWKKFPGHEGPSVEVSESDGSLDSSEVVDDGSWIIFKDISEIVGGSVFDNGYEGQLAQYAKKDGSPKTYWNKVETKLMDLDTSKLHYVLLPEQHIVIDLDLKNSNGEKELDLNLAAAKKFPKTYAEVSKSGQGIHLHYIYDGDPKELSHIYDDHIEIKTFGGSGPLRRKLTKCNDLPISHINSGLPLKGVKNTVVDMNVVNLEKSLRTTIKKCLRKEVHPDTTSNIDFIKKILDDAYASGKAYDVSDLRQSVLIFANNASNQSEKCVKAVGQMKWKSENVNAFEGFDSIKEYEEENNEEPIIFFDWEVFPNFCCMCWKVHGKDGVVKMINPSPTELEPFTHYRLVGFNNRKYDNHIFYARWLKHYTNKQLYDLSTRLIGKKDSGDFGGAYFAGAYDLSYTDVLDFSSKKQGLKKWEIELGLFHVENEHPWDEPLDEKYWDEVSDYCANDVIATEAVFNARYEDFVAREILADLSKMFSGKGNTNSTTNSLTTNIILRGDKQAKKQFVYPDLSKLFPGYEFNSFGIDKDRYNPDTKIVKGRSLYLGEDPGEGGYVYSRPGMYYNVVTFDVASMHPSSIIAENGFGKYTKNFAELLEARICIKHKDFDKARTLFNGALAKYLDSDNDEELKKKAKALSYALKIAANSVYGLTSAGFDNDLKDPRNVDNWVAKRGALMMITLKNEVLKRGFTVIHCKTDSIKVVAPSDEISNYICDFGKKYGYTFEIEAKYERICLVNEAVYIARYSDYEGNDEPGCWTATGTQFKIPYVFKELFSKEPIEFDDMCETKSVSKADAMYLDFNEGFPEDEHAYYFAGKVGKFTPMLPGVGAGELMSLQDGKYSYVSGSKGYRWFESSYVKEKGLEEQIDKSYYRKLCDDAIETVSKYGNFDEFVHGEQPPTNHFWDFMNIPEDADEENGVPFDTVA